MTLSSLVAHAAFGFTLTLGLEGAGVGAEDRASDGAFDALHGAA